MGVQQLQSRATVLCLKNIISQLPQHLATIIPHVTVVLHDQDCFMRRALGHDRSCLGLILRNRRMDAWEIEFDRRSFAYFTIYFDMAARLFGETIDLRQTKAGTVSYVLCREEGIEGLRQHVRGHPASTIGYSDHNVLAGYDLDLTHGVAFVEIDIRG